VVLIDPLGHQHPRDDTLSNAVETKASPLLSFHQGRLRSQESVTVADVFVTPRNATRYNAWKLRPAPISAQAYKLPQTRDVPSPDCPRTAPPVYIEPEAAG
jgi:hypothetical protein